MESKKINQLATELTPALSDLTIIGDPTTGISKKITLSQMASLFTGTVEEYANLAAFPLVGVADTIYIALDTNIIYRYDTSLNAYVILSPNIINSLVFSDANGFDGTITLVGSVATLSITTALTLGSVPFIGASGALLQDNANFFWDDTNNRLGLGTNAPTTAIDAFGSGIIGRLNGTSTNNSFLGFASAGTNKWSIGNVQSDHRFRIYSEANTAELFTILPTGEIGIGISNPTTKFHIDGAASALIANLDANVSVAKSISFRSDNSNRINLEVSGTESGTNAGANFFLRAYSDAGALLSTPLTITRSTGAATFINSLTSGGQNSINASFGTTISAISIYNNTVSNESNIDRLEFRLNNTFGGNEAVAYITALNPNAASNNGGHLIFSTSPYTTSSTPIERLRIAESGNIGISVTPSSFSVVGPVIQFTGGGFVGGQGTVNTFYVGSNNFYNGTNFKYVQDGFATNYQVGAGTGGFTWSTSATGLAGNNITFNTAMSLTNSGNLLLNTGVIGAAGNALFQLAQSQNNWIHYIANTASTGAIYGNYIHFFNQAPNNSTSIFLFCGDNAANRVSLYSNGGIANFQANNVNLSDERTKKDIIPLESYWDKFKAIEIVKFKYIDQTHDDFNIGVIAQQVEKVAPEFIDIDGWNNKPELDEEGNEIINIEEPLMSVYTSDLHHATIKVLQEAMAKIEILEEEVKLLKAK